MLALAYQYHTEKDPADPAGKRNLRTASRYRIIGRVESKEDFEKASFGLRSDAKRLLPWKWPDDPSWDGSVLYMKDASNACFSNWLRLRLRKAVPWETALRILAGYRKDTDRRSKTFGEYAVFVPNAVYDTEGYSCSDGSVVSLTDREALASKRGQNVWKEIRMKLVGPRNPDGTSGGNQDAAGNPGNSDAGNPAAGETPGNEAAGQTPAARSETGENPGNGGAECLDAGPGLGEGA